MLEFETRRKKQNKTTQLILNETKISLSLSLTINIKIPSRDGLGWGEGRPGFRIYLFAERVTKVKKQ